MKKTFKRLGAVLLAAFMMLSTMVCASADDTPMTTPAPNKTITLTVNDVSDHDTVYAYRLVSYDETGYKFDDSFASYIKATGKTENAQTYLSQLDSAGVNKLLDGYATECNKTDSTYQLPNEFTHVEAANNKASLTLEPGYYLLLTTTTASNGRIYTPVSAFVKMDGDDLVVYAGSNSSALTKENDDSYVVNAKSAEGPTIDKKTNATKGESSEATWKETAAAGVGDTVRFYVAVNIPAYSSVQELKLTVNDTLTNLKYNEGSVKVYENKPDPRGNNDSNIEIKDAIKNTDFAEKYTVDESTGIGTQKLTFELDYQKIMNGSTQAKTVYVYYETTMQKEAVAKTNHQGENVATLKYSNASNPGSEHTTDKKDTDVYTYYMQVNKKKGESEIPLKGAKFSLYPDETSETPIGFVKVTDGNTVYYRPAVAGTEDDTAEKVTQIEADFQLRGLDASTYYLEEVETPKGYYKPEGRFKIQMTSKMDGNKHTSKLDGDTSSITAVKDADQSLIFKGSGVATDPMHQFNVVLKNSATPNLPTTGGAGTMLLSIGGVALMAAGAYLIFFRKKEN